MLPLLLAAVMAQYEIRPAPDSQFALEVHKTGLMRGRKHVFVFERYRGELRFDPADPAGTHVRFVVEANSIVCTDTWVSEKDRKKILQVAMDDMLDAQRHPELVFESSGISGQAGRYRAAGTLTVRGITKPVLVEVTASGSDRLHLEGNALVKLRDYGLKPPSAALGAIGTKDEMIVRFRLVAAARPLAR